MKLPKALALALLLLASISVASADTPLTAMRHILVYNGAIGHCALVSVYIGSRPSQWTLVTEPTGAPRFVRAFASERFHFVGDFAVKVRAQISPDASCSKGVIADVYSPVAAGVDNHSVTIKESGTSFVVMIK